MPFKLVTAFVLIKQAIHFSEPLWTLIYIFISSHRRRCSAVALCTYWHTLWESRPESVCVCVGGGGTRGFICSSVLAWVWVLESYSMRIHLREPLDSN